jgi:hypothetical protein
MGATLPYPSPLNWQEVGFMSESKYRDNIPGTHRETARILRHVAAAFAIAGVACSANPSQSSNGVEDDLTASARTAAHFRCTGANLVSLDVVTTAKGRVKVTELPSTDIVSSGKLRKDGSANLGEFSSEDHGTFTIKLDGQMLEGRAGTAVLTDEEPGDGPMADTYQCSLAP